MNQEFDEWEVFTGRLITHFGSIELLVSKLLEIWLPKLKVFDYTLEERLNKLIELY